MLVLVLAFFGAGFSYDCDARIDRLDQRSVARAGDAGEIVAHNHCAQNHMVSLTEIKGGALRLFALRLAFWGVGQLSPLLFRPGYLGPIGTIHFARWVKLPGTRDLAFLSNYGGSWQAYLEDFITLAHFGLTAVWSKTVGFRKPATWCSAAPRMASGSSAMRASRSPDMS